GAGVLVAGGRGARGRRQRVADDLRPVLVPQHYVRALTAQLAGNSLTPRAAHADAGALGINALVLGAYGDLGPRTRVAGSTHDLDQLLGDLRHFDTEQLDDHLRTGAGQHQLR